MNLTLNVIRAKSPCHDGWATLLAALGKTKADDEPLPPVSWDLKEGCQDSTKNHYAKHGNHE